MEKSTLFQGRRSRARIGGGGGGGGGTGAQPLCFELG